MGGGEVNFFVPCFVDQFFPDAAFAAVKVMEALGCKVHCPEGQTCCGQPSYNAGYWEEATPVVRKWLNDFSGSVGSPDRPVVVMSSSCTGMIRNAYGSMLPVNSPGHLAWKSIRDRTFEWTEWVHAHPAREGLGSRFPHKVTYHDACSALRECGIKPQVRELLAAVSGLELVELPESETCCGFGGTFAVKYEGISTAMADQKISHALSTGAEYLVSADLSCLMHLQGYANKLGTALKSMHLAEVLASGW